MVIEDFKTFEGKMNINEFIDMIQTLQKMCDTIDTLKLTKPKMVQKKILSFLEKNEDKLDKRTIEKLKYISKVWMDVFEDTDIVFNMRRRIGPIIEELKKHDDKEV